MIAAVARRRFGVSRQMV